MTWNDIEQILRSSNTTEWRTVTFGPTGARSVSAYKDDLMLRVEISYLDDDVDNADFREPWANGFPNPKATSYFAHLFYGPTCLGTDIVVSVDGGRAMLPLPDSTTFQVKGEAYLVASLFDTTGTLDQYMARAGLTIA